MQLSPCHPVLLRTVTDFLLGSINVHSMFLSSSRKYSCLTDFYTLHFESTCWW